MKYPCLCCGYQTLTQTPPGTWDICPVCFWEDLPAGWRQEATGISLRQGQTNFLAFGACSADWIAEVRSPAPTEARPHNWQTLAEQETVRRTSLIQGITQAFADVARGDGITLHQARVLDDYGSPEEEAKARLLDTDTRWWEVPDQWIAEFSEALNFVDPPGFCYYLPAYMIWTLNHMGHTNSFTADATIYSLYVHKGSEQWRRPYFAILSPAQSTVVCQFLKYVVWLGEDFADIEIAQKALDQRWSQFCNPD
ncbi:MAG: DUF6714 family protein [Cyanobacteria bacterium P01_H01_bin.119]